MEIIVALCLLVALTAGIWRVDRAISRSSFDSARRSPAAFPSCMPREMQWQRTTSVVERSIERAANVVAANVAAARQLEAAEYALHCLLEEIGGVMRIHVQSPLLAHVAPIEIRQGCAPTAMAA